jgi:hypothetical protein
MATGQGTLVFDFGNASGGTNLVTVFVPSPSISANSKIELYIMGTDSTAEHNAYEHSLIEFLDNWQATPISITAGSGFTAQAASKLKLTGTIQCRYVWSD